MRLAALVAGGEEALICDFAQYYHIYNWRGLPLRTAAALAAGLPSESRCRMRELGLEWPINTMLLAMLCDFVQLSLWARTKAAGDGQQPPSGVLAALLGKDTQEKEPPCAGFESAEAFRVAWNSTGNGQ